MAVLLTTSLGDITIDLFTKKAPKTCKNFLKLCKIKYYNSKLHFTQGNSWFDSFLLCADNVIFNVQKGTSGFALETLDFIAGPRFYDSNGRPDWHGQRRLIRERP